MTNLGYGSMDGMERSRAFCRLFSVRSSGCATPLECRSMTDAPDASIPVLTIDGPSGSGKGTISRHVARALGWHYLDSGALYRAVGIAASWADIDLSDASALVRCTFDTEVGFRDEAGDEPRVIVNGV